MLFHKTDWTILYKIEKDRATFLLVRDLQEVKLDYIFGNATGNKKWLYAGDGLLRHRIPRLVA